MAEIVAADAPDALELAAQLVGRGELVALPTETVYGLAVLPQPTPLERLVAAKRRSTDKGIQLLVDSLDQVRSLAIVPEAAEQLARRYWPGPLTLVLARREGVELPELLTGGRPTVGLRLPDHEIPRALARRLGPIAASSANVSGQPDATTAEQVQASLGAELALIVDDGPVRGGVPSSVVACLPGDPGPAVLREGALSVAEILEATR